MAFAIDDLTSVIAHWSADQITGLSDGDPVDTLPDSISSWDLAGTTTTRPLYRPTGIGGLPAVDFDGTDDWMITGSKVLTIVNPGYCFVVNVSTVKNYNHYFALATGSGVPTYSNAATKLLSMSSTSYTMNQAWNSGNSYKTSPPAPTVSTDYLVSCSASAIDYEVRIDGAVTSGSYAGLQVAPTISATTLYASVGKSSLGVFDGLMAELVLFDETVASERLYIEGVLAHKYGITLPTTHPFYAAAPTSGPPTGGGVAAVHPLNKSSHPLGQQ